jgi:hypothetical protein
MAVDITINETIDLVDITVNPNIIEVNVTRTSGGGGSGTIPSLDQVATVGNEIIDKAIIVRNTAATNSLDYDPTSGTLSININGSYNALLDGQLLLNSSDNIEASINYNASLIGFVLGSLRLDATNLTADTTVTFRDGVSGDIAFTSDITTPTLQEVTDEGNVTLNDIQIGDGLLKTLITPNEVQVSIIDGIDFDRINLGFNGLSRQVSLDNAGIPITQELSFEGVSTDEILTIPNKSGTLATLDDIPAAGVPYTGATEDVNLGEFGLLTGNIEFDTTPTNIPTGAGSMVWNDTDGTVDLKLKGANVTLQIGQENVIRVVNKTATNINLLEANYQAVRVTGAQGQRLKVDLAQATTDALSAETIGLVTETINNNQEGFITTSGLIRNVNTTGSLQSETWADGDILYLSPTVAGRVTKVKPTAPNHLVIIGYVIHAHATQGSIFVKVDNGYELDELHNVKITTAANGQALTYTSATDIWENKTIIEDTIVDSVTDKAPSQNAVFDALALKQNTSTLIFDSLQKAIMRDNYFWFVPASISTGFSGYNFGLSERISGASFLYLNNGAITRGLLAFNTTIVPGILAFSRRNDALILTGLEVVFTRKIQFNSNVSGQRFFSGISKGNQFTAPTNVEPSTLTDIVGVCQLSSSTNMHVVHNDASGTATTIDLGSSYPCTDSQYNYYITIEQTTTTYIVTVERVTITTGASISTTNTLSTNIPNYATGTIQLITWISNNATAATASYLDGGAIGNIKNQ